MFETKFCRPNISSQMTRRYAPSRSSMEIQMLPSSRMNSFLRPARDSRREHQAFYDSHLSFYTLHFILSGVYSTMSSRRQFSVSQMRLRIVVVTSSPLESLVSVQVEMPTARRISVRVMPRSINSFQSRLYETPYLTSFQKDTAYIMSNFQLKNQTQSFFVGCDSKVLKHSAGGVATRRARPIRFVVDPRPLASFHYILTFHSCAATNRIGRIYAGCSVGTQSQTLDAVAPHLSPRSTDWPFESKS